MGKSAAPIAVYSKGEKVVQKIIGTRYVIEQGTYVFFLLTDEGICFHKDIEIYELRFTA